MPHKETYSASKYFDLACATALGYELDSIDVLSVMPGVVATPMSGFKQSDSMKGVTSAAQCASGILNNARSGLTYGSLLHEILGCLMKTLIDVLP